LRQPPFSPITLHQPSCKERHAISRKPADKTTPSDAPEAEKATSDLPAPPPAGKPADAPVPSGTHKKPDIPTVDDLQDVSSMSDEDLMKMCQEGDEAAFEVLFIRYEGQALSFIHRLIGDQNRTEALGQEAFLRIFKDAKSYQYPRSFTTWFYTIVRNLCKNELRWRSRHPTVSIEDNLNPTSSKSDDSPRIGDFLRSEGQSPLDEMVNRERDQRLEKALEMLPEAEREVLILNRFQGLKYREIAEVVGVPVGTVRQRIYSALERLRKAIKDYL
jgi:RNA polymerase sigma-70 factor (ECF subfamily)